MNIWVTSAYPAAPKTRSRAVQLMESARPRNPEHSNVRMVGHPSHPRFSLRLPLRSREERTDERLEAITSGPGLGCSGLRPEFQWLVVGAGFQHSGKSRILDIYVLEKLVGFLYLDKLTYQHPKMMSMSCGEEMRCNIVFIYINPIE